MIQELHESHLKDGQRFLITTRCGQVGEFSEKGIKLPGLNTICKSDLKIHICRVGSVLSFWYRDNSKRECKTKTARVVESIVRIEK